MLELIQKIKDYTEAGIILNHMELFDEVGNMTCKDCEYCNASLDNWCDRLDLFIPITRPRLSYDSFYCNEWKGK